ncbi:family 43 glycosylhydrolase [Hymenobacter fodinae]|uniref:T9SS type A sorting domain-containing protein n=1 Tax=Hymenobacter fodinae TaxID=2510796 RepID=A0A4Z0P9P4_9BACT|nr:family 43 glycosylhydrolase [Hymenobacter fodinae]TGE08628.1 T9SS type A sorting domain-containing protein [Hymenobacter fodinae]
MSEDLLISMQSPIKGGQLRRLFQLKALLFVLLGWPSEKVYALQGFTGVHDPSTIVKEGNKYWIFATGRGIYSMYSTDLVNWTPGPRPVFANNASPSWITTKVPGFTGDFWAPECIFMNGKYYLYYSCSTFGSKVSAIGLATNVTLDPSSPNYKWEDQGEVVSTNAGSDVNAIDPAVFRDSNNDVWFTYGSFFGGIRITQLNGTTGKPLGNTTYAIANENPEAAYLTKNGSYYYLFINRGACCNGVNSTYYIIVGRSTSPTGPFLDQNGVSLNNGGGTLVLNVSGRYVGPGHTGILEEGGVSYFSHHYYDGEDNGAPKLGLAKLTWTSTGWPSVSRDWVAAGRYEIKNQNSNLIWDAWGCTGVAGQMVAQGTPAGLTCQRWDFTALGDGEYKITNAMGGLAANVAGCSAAAGAKLQLDTYSGTSCQRFTIDRANDGTLVFASVNGNRVVEVPNASTTVGQQLGLWDYNGCACQRWSLTNVGVLASANRKVLSGVSVYPQPASTRGFTVELSSPKIGEATHIVVTDLKGATVYRREFSKQLTTLTVDAMLPPGVYQVEVRRGNSATRQKLVIL